MSKEFDSLHQLGLRAFLLSHLWCHKVGGVTGGEEQAVASPKLLGESKVTDPDGVGISRVVHVQDVTGLQVPVYHLGGGGEILEGEKGGIQQCSRVYKKCFLTPWQWR